MSASSWGGSLGITVGKKRKEMKLLLFCFTSLTGKSCIVLCIAVVLSKLNLPFVMSLKGSDSFHLMGTTQTDEASVWAGGHKQRDKYATFWTFAFLFRLFVCLCVCFPKTYFELWKCCPVFFDLKFKNHLKSWINLFFISIWQTTPVKQVWTGLGTLNFLIGQMERRKTSSNL